MKVFLVVQKHQLVTIAKVVKKVEVRLETFDAFEATLVAEDKSYHFHKRFIKFKFYKLKNYQHLFFSDNLTFPLLTLLRFKGMLYCEIDWPL